MAENEIVRRHHPLSGCGFEETGREWRTEEPGVVQSMGLPRVGHN